MSTLSDGDIRTVTEGGRLGELQPQILDADVGKVRPVGHDRGLVGADVVEQRIAERHCLSADRRDPRRLRDHRPVRKGPVVRADRQVGVAVKRFQYPAFRSVDREPLQLDDVADLQL